jgi:hypothetical protein
LWWRGARAIGRTSGIERRQQVFGDAAKPALPDPVRVSVKPATTAVLVSDMIDPTCKTQPKCTGTMVPAIAALLAQARKAGMLVAYSTREASMSKWLPEVAPAAGDPTVPSQAQDRFYNTDLDKTLKAKGITTLIITGWKISGSVLYTVDRSHAAGLHSRYTHRCQHGRNRLRDGHRYLPGLESEQRQRHQRAAEGKSFDLEPLGYDQLPAEERSRAAIATLAARPPP